MRSYTSFVLLSSSSTKIINNGECCAISEMNASHESYKLHIVHFDSHTYQQPLSRYRHTYTDITAYVYIKTVTTSNRAL